MKRHCIPPLPPPTKQAQSILAENGLEMGIQFSPFRPNVINNQFPLVVSLSSHFGGGEELGSEGGVMEAAL